MREVAAIVNGATIYLLVFITICSSAISANITSSPQLGVDTVCDNQDVTLMCHTDQTTGSMITWYWSNQSQHGDNITVVATMTGVMYTCEVTNKDGHHLGNATISVVANGIPPLVNRYSFNPYVLQYDGSNLTLVTAVSSDLPLSSDDIKWVGFHRPLPSTAVVDNYTTDGVLYSRLSLYELSFEDDSGNYTNIVSNQCGTSSVSVYVDVRKAPIVCSNSGTVAVPQKDILTVKGESIILECLFKGNLKVLEPSISSYWMIGPNHQHTIKPTYIMDNSTDPYRIAVYQTCLSEDGSCCNFTSQLSIQDVPLELHNISVTCGEVLDEKVNTHAAFMTVFDIPTVAKCSDSSIKAHINDSKTLQCQFNAPTANGVTVVVWTKGDISIVSSEHYKIITSAKPGQDNLIVSQLTINSITSADEGRYSCYCYYNTSLVTSSKQIISNEKIFRVYLKKRNDFPVVYVATGSGGLLVVLLVAVAIVMSLIICKYRRYRRRLSSIDEAEDEKRILVDAEEETNGYGSNDTTTMKVKAIVMENHVNRGDTSASTPNTSGPMKSVLDQSQASVNRRSGSINSNMCVTPTMVTEDTDSEENCEESQLLINKN